MDTFHDLLSGTLETLRIHSTVLLREAYAPPWSIGIPESDKLSGLLKAPDTHVVAFHFVEQGGCIVEMEQGQTKLDAGQLAVCFGGARHQLRQGTGTQTVGLETLLLGGRNVFRKNELVVPNSTALLCGVFVLRDARLNPLLSALPPLLHLSTCAPDQTRNVAGILQMIRCEMDDRTLGGRYIVERFAEVLCVEVIRAYAANLPTSSANWLTAIGDPVVGKAIAAVHARPAHPWSVAALADLVAFSPSRFSARFVAAVGTAPMTYVAQWRMNLASRLLRDSRHEIASVAAQVGYESLPAFYRAFKRYVGTPPAQYRLAPAASE